MKALGGQRPSVEFTRSLKRDLKAAGISEQHLRKLLKTNDSELLALGPSRVWMLVFEHNPKLADRGYILRGFQRGEDFVVDEVKNADPRSEIRYFRQLAEEKHVDPRVVMLKRSTFNNCRNLFVRASTQVKLWLKHQLRIEDVVEILESPTSMPAMDRNHSATFNNRFRYAGVDHSGRPLRAIIEVQPDCFHTLITAFEEP